MSVIRWAAAVIFAVCLVVLALFIVGLVVLGDPTVVPTPAPGPAPVAPVVP